MLVSRQITNPLTFPLKLICLILSALVWSAGAGQYSESADDFVVQVWDTDSGLPHSSVSSIAQTPDGYLWIGTLFGGLARFDGVRFVNFHPGNTPELRSMEIQNVLVDSQGTLWVDTVIGALSSLRDGRFRFEQISPEMPQSWLGSVLSSDSNSVVLSSISGWLFRGTRVGETNHWDTIKPPVSDSGAFLCADARGVIWYRLYDGSFGQVCNNQFIPMPEPPGLRSLRINTLATDVTSQIWVGTDKELARWDGKQFENLTPTNGEPDLRVQQIATCPDGSLWVWAENKLRKCRGRQWVARVKSWDGPGLRSASFPTSPLGHAKRSIYADSRGGLWVSHYGDGLWHVGADGQVSHVGEAQGLPNALVECWFEDREGNVWLGLNGGGLACVRVRAFHTVWPPRGVMTAAARSVCEDQAGVMWFGTSGDTVLRWRNGEFTNFIPPTEKTVGREITVCPDAAGRLWVGSVQNGVVTLEAEKFARPFPADDIGTVARVIYKDKADKIWLGGEFGLFCWEQGRLKRFRAADGFTPAYVTAITEDRTGNLWIGTALGELRRYQNGKFTSYWPKDSPTDPQIAAAAATAAEGEKPSQNRSLGVQTGGERFLALYADDEGVLWTGALGGGLLRFKDGQFTRFTTRDDLPSEYVSQILEDGNGHLWLGTRVGIVRVSKRELNDFADGGKVLPTCVTYGKFDGLPTLECSGGSQPNCWRSHDGHLWFATVKGAVWVDPAMLRPNRLPPPVRVEEVLVDGKSLAEKNALASQPSVELPKKISIAAGQHYFEFRFCALSFTAPDKVKFKWRLAGLEKNWVDGGNRRAASYSFIPPGSYRFETLACNNDGVWSESPATVELTVLPYFWQRWWFKLAIGLGIVAVLVTIYSVRITRLRAMESLRLRIARDLHDEVGANLGSISLLAQIMEQSPSSADATQVRGLAVQTIDTLRDIIWFIDPTHDKLSDLVARLQETARVMLATIACQFEQSGDFRSANLPLSFRRNVPPLFKETLHNVLKHSRATQVQISIQRLEKQFTFRVQDNGVGFHPGAKSSGNGLKNLKRRAQEIGGHLKIESSPGDGTTITLTAPIP